MPAISDATRIVDSGAVTLGSTTQTTTAVAAASAGNIEAAQVAEQSLADIAAATIVYEQELNALNSGPVE